MSRREFSVVHRAKPQPSATLQAMGFSLKMPAKESIRVSVSCPIS